MTAELEHLLLADDATLLQRASAEPPVLATLVKGLHVPDDKLRSRSFDLLFQIAATHPAALAPHWPTLVALLDSPNAFHRAIGLRLLALLAADPRFDNLLPRLLALLDDSKVMVARYLAQSLPDIVALRPDLHEALTAAILQVDSTHHTPGRLALIKADLLAYLEIVWDVSQNRARFLDLARGMLDSDSPSARQAARRFLQRFNSSDSE